MGLRAAIVIGLENIRVRSGLRGERVRVISVQPLPTPSAPTEASSHYSGDHGGRHSADCECANSGARRYELLLCH